jgi:hypothetical protein
LREWYVIISREIFNPNYALFKSSPGDRCVNGVPNSSPAGKMNSVPVLGIIPVLPFVPSLNKIRITISKL